MTSYITIPNTSIDPNSPVTSDLMTYLRDNPIAITEGATGAPRIQALAMYSPAAGNNKLVDFIQGFGEQYGSTGSASVKQSYFTAVVACTIRVYLTFTISTSGTGTGSVSIYKNGASVQSWPTGQTGVTVDVTLAIGDTLHIRQAANQGSGTSTVTITAGEYRVDTRSLVRA